MELKGRIMDIIIHDKVKKVECLEAVIAEKDKQLEQM
jgi:hypothetical protein